MYGRPILSVYARDLKPGMVTRDNGEIVRIRPVVPQFYQMRPWGGLEDAEPMTVGIRYVHKMGVQILAPHDIVALVRL